MKANEYVKQNGWTMARKAVAECTYGYGIDLDELKRLVKSHDLIKSYKGCGKPKETALETAKFTLKHFESTRGLEVELFGNNNRELELKQAIADVESCQ